MDKPAPTPSLSTLRQWGLPIVLGSLCVVAAVMLTNARGNVSEQIAIETEARDKAVAVERVRTAMLDAETGQRGYLLTNDPAYLEPFERAVRIIDSAVLEAFDHSSSQSREAAEVERRTNALITDKLAEMRETIRLHDAGDRDAAIALVKTDRGKADMDQIRSVLDVVISEAANRRDAAQAEKRRWRKRVTNAFMTILGLMSVMLAWAVMNASRARRTALAERSLALSEDARDRTQLLAGELDHRMKNIFAVMSGMIRQTARRASPDVRDYAATIDARLTSLGKAYAMTRELGEPRKMNSAQIMDEVVRAQIADANALEVDGETLTLGEGVVTPLALILHELTTNSLKYGAWKPRLSIVNDNSRGATPSDSGVRVEWRREGGDVVLLWREKTQTRPDPDAVSSGGGYGSKLIDGCARQIGGTVTRDWTADGLSVELRVPQERLLAA